MFEGVLVKMQTEYANPIRYYLNLDTTFIRVNDLLQRKITLTHTGFSCLNCGATTPIYRQGFCRSCFFEVPAAADWIMRPELSQAHLGIEDRDLAYEEKVQLQPHVVYFALSSGLKVGVTRHTQIPTRWIDQGAHKAFPIVEVPNRYLAGIAEVALKEHYNDKTNWRLMLTQIPTEVDMLAERQKAIQWLPDEVKPYASQDQHPTPTELHFPVDQYPQKVQSLNLLTSKSYSGKLVGIKGQYFIFEDQTVFNVRGHEGHRVEITLD